MAKNATRACLAGISTLAVGVALAMASPAQAQTSNSTLRGRAPAGATVIATEVNTGAVRRTTVNADGTYVIVGLPSGNYHVTAGDDLSADVAVSVASVSVVDLEPAAVEADNGNTILVVGRQPTVEVHSSQVNQIVTLHDIASLPQSTRNFLEFADTVPGMQFTRDQKGNTSIRGGAQLSSAANIYIDGVSWKDFVGSGGGTSGSGSGFTGSGGANGQGDPGNPFPQLAIGEYKVVTSNYSAEYGDASSAIIIAQTKSGTNEFHGEIFANYTDQNLRASLPSETEKARQSSKEYGAALGGPIIKDVAHFFFTWEHKSLAISNTVYPNGAVPASAIALLPESVSSQLGAVTNPFKENLYFGKIDIEPTAFDRIEFTGNLRLETNITGASGQNAASTAVPYKNDVKRGDMRWQHSTDHWVNEFRVSYQDARSAAVATEASPQYQYSWFPNDPSAYNSAENSASIINVGGPGSGVGAINRQWGWTFADNLTFSNLDFAGNHTIKVGGTYSAIKLKTQNASTDLANATYYYAVTADGVADTPWQVQFANIVPGYSPNVTTTDKQFGLYIQDNWQVNDKLTLDIGLRWDHEEVPAYLNYQTPSAVVSAINGSFCGADATSCATTKTYAQVLATSVEGSPGIDINDYISTGSNRKAPHNFSPRIGFSYDFHEDGSFVLFGGYARTYNRNLFSTLALETTKIALNNNPQVFFPSAQTLNTFGGGQCKTQADVNPTNHCYAWDPAYLTPEGLATLQTSPTSHEVDLINNNIKTPYADQFSLGIRNRIGEWNTQATLAYIASYDGIYGHWGGRYADGSFYQNGSQWGAQGVPGVGSLILWDNGFKDRNFQVSLAAQKPYTKASGWSATVSYTYSAASQNNSYAYGSAGNMYMFDYPTIDGYPMLRSTAVPRHRLVMTGTYDLPWGIQFGGKVSLATAQSVSQIYGCSDGIAGCTPYNSIGGGTAGIKTLKPDDFLGYKNIDVQFTKNFTLVKGTTAYGRVDILNLFNWKNYDPAAIVTTSVDGLPVSAAYDSNGAIVGTPFMVRFSAGVRF